jgi:NHL repeat
LLRFPRWAHVVDRDEIVVSDYANHRIVHLRRSR